MSDFWLLYWLTRLDGLVEFCNNMAGFWLVVSVVIATCAIFIGIAYSDGYSPENEKKHWRWWRWSLFVSSSFFFFFSFTQTLIPTTKEAAFIWGGTAVLEAAKSETAKRLVNKSTLIVEQYLDQYLKEENAQTKLPAK